MASTEYSAKWQQFRKSKLGLVFGLMLTALASLVLLLYGGFIICLVPIVVALIIYVVPRYFGLKDKKKAIAFGLALMVVLGLFLGFTYYSLLKDIEPAKVSSLDGILSEGQVSPFRGDESIAYNYSVQLSGGNATPEVWVTIYDYNAANQATTINLTHSFNLTSGERVFYGEKVLPRSIYRYAFSVRTSPTEISTTATAWGPFMVTDQDMLIRELWYNTLYVFINVGIWFAFVLMASWWMESSKRRMEDLQKRKKEGKKPENQSKEKFVCSECGADVPDESKECPQCGEKFDD